MSKEYPSITELISLSEQEENNTIEDSPITDELIVSFERGEL